jgi:hypothetical protein
MSGAGSGSPVWRVDAALIQDELVVDDDDELRG